MDCWICQGAPAVRPGTIVTLCPTHATTYEPLPDPQARRRVLDGWWVFQINAPCAQPGTHAPGCECGRL